MEKTRSGGIEFGEFASLAGCADLVQRRVGATQRSHPDVDGFITAGTPFTIITRGGGGVNRVLNVDNMLDVVGQQPPLFIGTCLNFDVVCPPCPYLLEQYVPLL